MPWHAPRKEKGEEVFREMNIHFYKRKTRLENAYGKMGMGKWKKHSVLRSTAEWVHADKS
jgi:hypothetical protein